MNCPACSQETPETGRFCANCGTPLVQSCPSCAAELIVGKPFCAECGTRVHEAAAAPLSSASPAPEPFVEPIAERRLCSVLFVDLVGFTPFAEHARSRGGPRAALPLLRPAAQAIIESYGGTLEKFIGDAVMAVWGAPVANEDDAERAVRAALEIVAAVADLGSSRRSPASAARARRRHRRGRRSRSAKCPRAWCWATP